MADDNTDLKDEVAEVLFFPYFFFINSHFFFALICFIYMFLFNDENIENKALKMTRESSFLSLLFDKELIYDIPKVNDAAFVICECELVFYFFEYSMRWIACLKQL